MSWLGSLGIILALGGAGSFLYCNFGIASANIERHRVAEKIRSGESLSQDEIKIEKFWKFETYLLDTAQYFFSLGLGLLFISLFLK